MAAGENGEAELIPQTSFVFTLQRVEQEGNRYLLSRVLARACALDEGSRPKWSSALQSAKILVLWRTSDAIFCLCKPLIVAAHTVFERVLILNAHSILSYYENYES